MERAHCVQEMQRYQDGPGISKPREEWYLVKLGLNRDRVMQGCQAQ